MRKFKHLFTLLLLLCATVATAHDFEVDGIYYNITDATNKTVAVTYRGSSYSAYSNEYAGSVVIPETVTMFKTFDTWTSTNKNNSTTSQTSYTLNVAAGNILKFDWSVSSESDYDWLIITLDGTEIVKKSGTLSGSYEKTFDTSGSHTLVVKYTKDHSQSSGNDEGKIYNITLSDVNNVVYRVTSIGTYAFYGCSGLTSIEIPNSVTSIGVSAFHSTAWYNNNPDGIVYIGKILYDYKGTMPANTSITIKEGTLGITASAFYGCSGLTSIEIPNSVTNIGSEAFRGCTGLTSIEIPNSVTSIGSYAFYNCSGLKTVYNFSNLSFSKGSSSNGYVAYYADNVVNAPNASNVVIEGDYAFAVVDGVNNLVTYLGDDTELTLPADYNGENYVIGDGAFANCENITTITIPTGVVAIGENAFKGCTSLRRITVSNSVAHIGRNAFEGTAWFDNQPNGVVYAGKVLYKYKGTVSANTEVKIKSGTLGITEGAFSGCSGLTSVTIPNSVTSIGNFVFNGCTSLKSVRFEDCESTLTLGYNTYNSNDTGKGLFYDCPLETLYIGRELSYATDAGYGYSPFYNKSTLTSVIIGDNVTGIGSYAFYDCIGLTNITIPNSVTSIGDYAFYNCSGLSSVEIPNNVTSIGTYAFSNCSGLTSITLPNSVTRIENGAFQACSGLTSITIPSSVTYIGSSSFYYCTALADVVIGDGVTSIGESAFSGCSALASITIPSSVTSVGDCAFETCSSLKDLRIEDGEDLLYMSDNILGTGHTDNGLFSDCPLETLYMGRNISYFMYAGYERYGASPFKNKSTLTSLTIGKAVTNIEDGTFDGCTALKNLRLEDGDSILTLGYDANNKVLFSNCPLETLYLGRDLSYSSGSSYGYSPFYYKTKLTSLTIGDKVTTIGDYAFYNCSGLTSITIPNSVTSIGGYAFRGCSGLTSITIPNSVTSIGNYAFYNCSGLTSITLPNSVTSIGNYAFHWCFGLTSITIPNSVTSIGYYAFESCSGLTSITIPNSVTSIGNDAFNACTGLKEVHISDITAWCDIDFTSYRANPLCYAENLYLNGELVTKLVIPESVKEIKDYAFSGCSGLTSIEIPNSVTSIGNDAFSNCSGLTSITIPNSVTSIGNFAFSRCSGLTSITIPNSITSIGNYAFSGCSGLADVSIGTGVQTIGNCTFNGCTSLKNLRIEDGEGVLTLGYNDSSKGLFYDCPLDTLYLGRDLSYSTTSSYGYSPFYNKSTLTSVIIGDNVTGIGSYAFRGCTGLTSVEIPNSVKSIGSNAFYMSSNIKTVINCSSLNVVKGASTNGYVGYYADVVINAQGAESATIEGDFVFAVYDGVNTLIECLNTSALKNEVVKLENWTSTNTNDSSTSSHTYTIEAKKDDKLTFDWNVSSESSCDWLTVTINGTEVLKKSGIYSGSYEYLFTNDGTYTMVVKYTKDGSVNSGDDRGSVSNICLYRTYDEFVSEIVLPDNYKGETYVIAAELFKNNSEIKSVTIPEGVTEIGDYAFSGCTGLTSIVIPNSVTRIGDYAFYCGYALESVVIGSGVASIGESAFEGCNALTSMQSFIPAEKLFVPGDYAFYDIDKDACTLYVPKGAKDTYASTTGWDEFTDVIEFEEFYTATFVVDGEVVATYSLKLGDAITLPETPSKEGHTFSGWSEYPATMPAYDITIEGSFTVNYYTVTYLVDGEVWATESVAYGSEIPLPETPSKEGHTFSGWGEYPATMPAYDITIEGLFNYTITYLVDGEVWTTETVAYGSEIPLPETPSKEGHTFSGWGEYPATMPAYDITIEGLFNYTITYLVDGEVWATETVAYGSEITLLDEPTKEGYTFSGWSEYPATMPANDITIEGSFTVNYYTITYLVDGEVWTTETVAYGSEITLLDEPTKEGYTFSGWSEYPATMPANDITIEGSFTVNYYTITYLVDGEVWTTETIAYGSEMTLVAEPSVDGYTFSGWSEYPATMPANDITIYGSFTVNYYTIKYLVDGEVWTTETYAYGSEITLLDEPTKEGYTFSGWRCERYSDICESPIDIAGNADNMLYSNAYCTNTSFGDEFAGWHVLFDGRDDTFFHSEYSNVDSSDGLDHYLRVDLGEGNEIEKFSFTYTTRKDNNVNSPTRIVVEGSNVADGEYAEIAVLTGLPTKNSTYESGILGNGNRYRFIRFMVTETNYNQKVYNHPFFYISEFGMTRLVEVVSMPETMPANDIIIEGTLIPITNIDDIESELEKQEIYNLRGERIINVDRLDRGIYIINGKKVFVK